MSKYTKFGVDIFNTFWVMGYNNKDFARQWMSNDDDDNVAIIIALLFLQNRQAKNAWEI